MAAVEDLESERQTTKNAIMDPWIFENRMDGGLRDMMHCKSVGIK